MTQQTYDSRPETYEHINQVRLRMNRAVNNLVDRATEHDKTKLTSPEVEIFDRYTPRLAETEYGSPEYNGYLRSMGHALQHHYEHNPHHPEHYENGIADMSLLDLIEMMCDWSAAALRTKDGDVFKSIEVNQKRFGYTDEVKSILIATARELGL